MYIVHSRTTKCSLTMCPFLIVKKFFSFAQVNTSIKKNKMLYFLGLFIYFFLQMFNTFSGKYTQLFVSIFLLIYLLTLIYPTLNFQEIFFFSVSETSFYIILPLFGWHTIIGTKKLVGSSVSSWVTSPEGTVVGTWLVQWGTSKCQYLWSVSTSGLVSSKRNSLPPARKVVSTTFFLKFWYH